MCSFRFKSHEKLWRGNGKLSADSVDRLRVYTHSAEFSSNIKLYVTQDFPESFSLGAPGVASLYMAMLFTDINCQMFSNDI